ncbi:hypothetical protein [Reichenbachiella sp.]|uniref:hypothetical protein n=1 Tax=Reichenbachiella sp. TaxID=2184521 RepID=UPI0032997900
MKTNGLLLTLFLSCSLIQAQNFTEPITVDSNSDAVLSFNNSDDSWQYFQFKRSGVRKTWMGLSNGDDFRITKEGGGAIVLSGANVGIGVTNPSALLQVGDGSAYFNATDVDNAGFRILFDKSTNNNGADVDLIINTNSGSPIVDWYVRNWGGSYTFNRGSSNGKTKLFEINNSGNVYVAGGNVAGKNGESISIGTNNNEITFNSDGASRFSITEDYFRFRDGNLYINNADADNAGLNIKFDKSTNNNGADVDLTIDTNEGSPIVDWYVRNWGGSYVFARGSSSGKRDLFRVENNGNITVPQGHAIVDGRVECEEVKVEVMDVPDYVFADNYKLSTLEETASYIQEYHHLPEIPSAKEMETDGVKLGEMNMLLLKKIEELTLHLIEKDSQMKKVMRLLEQQQEEIYDLKFK